MSNTTVVSTRAINTFKLLVILTFLDSESIPSMTNRVSINHRGQNETSHVDQLKRARKRAAYLELQTDFISKFFRHNFPLFFFLFFSLFYNFLAFYFVNVLS